MSVIFFSLGTKLVKHFLLAIIVTMALKRVFSKEDMESGTREVVEKTPVHFPVYIDT